jgi:hypothetical protein
MDHGLPRNVIGLAFALATLITHDVALVGQLLAIEPLHEETHAIALEPKRKLKLIRRHCLEIIRAVEIGRAVYVRGSGRLHILDMRLFAHMLRAFEHHVLEQVRKTGAAGPLIQWPHVIPQVDGHQR